MWSIPRDQSCCKLTNNYGQEVGALQQHTMMVYLCPIERSQFSLPTFQSE